MTSILRSSRLLYSLAGLTRHASSLVGKKKKFIFTNPQKIINFNELRIRNVVLSTEKKEDDELYSAEKFERDFHQLSVDVARKRVFKEDVEKIVENLKQNKEMKNSQIILLLECCTEISFMCSETERIKLAQNIWSTALNLGLKLNENHFNALLSVFVRNKHHFSCEKFLSDMEEAGVKPNLTTYRKLLRANCQQGNIENAKNILKKMKSLNYSINETDFNSLILGYSKIGDFEKANEILEVMNERGIKPESDSYVMLLCGYIENKKLDEFQKIFNDLCNKKNVKFLGNGLFEIIYTLAINKHEKYIDEVLEKLPKNFQFDKLLINLIQRLLHKNLDSVALKLLENIDVHGRSFNYGLSISRFLIDHFVYYRKPNEILDICEELEKRGLAKVAVGYSLKKIYSLKNENFILNFFDRMKNRGLPLREHYYWPVIIQASKKGNENLMQLLNKIPKSIFKSFEAVKNVILTNYKISENIKNDIEKLENVGIPLGYIGNFYLFEFLKENQMDMVELIAATYPVYITKISHFFNILFTSLERNPDNVEQVINILYYLYHDVSLSDNETTKTVFFDKAVTSLLLQFKDEKIILRLLEAMLEKKMGISSEIGSDIVKSLPNQNVEDLVSKLTDPNLKIELNQNTITSKLKSKNPNSATSLWECFKFMMRMTNNGKLNEAIKLLENFLEKEKDFNQNEIYAIKPIYRNIVLSANKEGTETQIKKLLDLGHKLNIFDPLSWRDDGLIILGLLKCNQTSEAIEKFKEVLFKSGKMIACMELFKKCISEGRTQEVEDIIKLISGTGNGNKAFTWLVFALATLGEVDKAKKVLDTTGFVFNSNIFINKLVSISDRINTETLEGCIKILSNVDNFDFGMTVLYKILVKKYAKNKDINKLQELCLEIQEKNIVNESFLKKLSEFQKNLDVIRLYNFLDETLEKINTSRSVKINSLDHILEDDFEENYQIAMRGNLDPNKVLNLSKQLAQEGEVDKIFSLMEIYSIQNNTNEIGTAFLKSGKVEEYFKFIDYLATKKNWIALSDSIRIKTLAWTLSKNDEYFNKYKSLAILCAKEANFSKPIISCFVTCIKLPGKLKEAEEILTDFSNYFTNLPYSQIKKKVEMNELSDNFYENVLSSKKLKNYFADHLHHIYKKVINSYYGKNNFDKALSYLKQAADDKVEEMIDQNLVSALKEKLKKEGESHPHLEEIHSAK